MATPESAPPASAPVPRSNNLSLYVGDLDANVTEQLLFDTFKAYGVVTSIRVLRDNATQESLGYAYVNYQNPESSQKAMTEMNYKFIGTKPCRIMYVNRNPEIRKSGVGNIYIRNLPKEMDGRALYELFLKFGAIFSCKLITDGKGESKGAAFVHYSDAESGRNAIASLNGKTITGADPEGDAKGLLLEPYQTPAVQAIKAQETFTNLYIKNFKSEVSEEMMKALMSSFGEIDKMAVQYNDKGGFGFCAFKEHASAVKAIEALHDKPHEYANGRDEKAVLYVQRAMRKKERQKYNRLKYRERLSQYATATNLYIKNLDDSVTDEKLKQVFSQFGDVSSARVMKTEDGLSKGFAFVSFPNPEHAKIALKELSHKTILSTKPLYVAYAQSKAERRAILENRQKRGFSDPSFGGPMNQHYAPPVYAGMPPFGGPNMSQFPQMNRPGMPAPGMVQRPGPGMMGPMGNQGGMMGAQRMQPNMGMGPGMQPRPMGPQGMVGQPPMNQMAVKNPMPPMVRPPINPQPAPQAQPRPPVQAAPKVSRGGLDHSQLASMPPDQVRNFLGEKLYHKIMAVYPEYAAKITGMLLEMDNSEVLNLLDSQDLLSQKVDEAMEVLRAHNK
eukprot:PhF_6_TR40602/c1_g1_i1/m.60906/K13126/PABPC; polyadenylate-binding protein